MAAQQQQQQPQALQQHYNPALPLLPASADAWGSDTEDDDFGVHPYSQQQWQQGQDQQYWHGSQTKQHQQRIATLLAQLAVRGQHQHQGQHQNCNSTHSSSFCSSTCSAPTKLGAVTLLHCLQTASQQQLGMQQDCYQQNRQQQQQDVPQLQALCLGVLGAHISQLAQQLGGQPGSLYWLPAEMKAALLAVARRRGDLSSAVLSVLADAEWRQLDLAGCSQLSGSQLLALAPLMPNIRLLDVTGLEQLSACGWRRLAAAWPHLTILRLGGSAAASAAALKALPHILPGLPQPAAAAAAAQGWGEPGRYVDAAAAVDCSCSWEEAFDSEADTLQRSSSNSSRYKQSQQPAAHSSSDARRHQPTSTAAESWTADCRLQQLRVLVWPDVPSEALQLVQQRCPRVLVNPALLLPGVVPGQVPLAEVDPEVALDEPLMRLVAGPWQVEQQASSGVSIKAVGGPQSQEQQPHLRRRASSYASSSKRRCRLAAAAAAPSSSEEGEEAEDGADSPTAGSWVASKPELAASHVLRALDAWLDEV